MLLKTILKVYIICFILLKNTSSTSNETVVQTMLNKFLSHYAQNTSEIDKNAIEKIVAQHLDIDHMHFLIYEAHPSNHYDKEKFIQFIALVFICYIETFRYLKINGTIEIKSNKKSIQAVQSTAPGNLVINFIVKNGKIYDIYFGDKSFFKLLQADILSNLQKAGKKKQYSTMQSIVQEYADALSKQLDQ